MIQNIYFVSIISFEFYFHLILFIIYNLKAKIGLIYISTKNQ